MVSLVNCDLLKLFYKFERNIHGTSNNAWSRMSPGEMRVDSYL